MNYFCRWINLKKVFPPVGNMDDIKSWVASFDHYNMTQKMKPTVNGMTDMLKNLDLDLEGRHHSGIDDCRNLARCVLELLKRGFSFN